MASSSGPSGHLLTPLVLVYIMVDRWRDPRPGEKGGAGCWPVDPTRDATGLLRFSPSRRMPSRATLAILLHKHDTLFLHTSGDPCFAILAGIAACRPGLSAEP